MRQTIKLFAYLAEQIAPQILIELPETVNRQQIIAAVVEQFPLNRTEIEGCNVAVNQAYITTERFEQKDIHEIALIPPVSGG